MTISRLDNNIARGVLQTLARYTWTRFGTTMPAAQQLTVDMGPVITIDATSAIKNPQLPTIDQTNDGMMFVIFSIGITNNIVVKDTTATITYATILPGKAAILVADLVANTWRVMNGA